MSLENIYFELSQNRADSYYIDLAEKEVMLLPILIDGIINEKSNSLWAENLVLKISEVNPLIVYPYFTYISKLTEVGNRIGQFSAWAILINLLSCDYQNLWNNVENDFYSFIESNEIAKISFACKCIPKIISAKECERDLIKKLLNKALKNGYIKDNNSVNELNTIANEILTNLLNNI